jgi:hypothetical protein
MEGKSRPEVNANAIDSAFESKASKKTKTLRGESLEIENRRRYVLA